MGGASSKLEPQAVAIDDDGEMTSDKVDLLTCLTTTTLPIPRISHTLTALTLHPLQPAPRNEYGHHDSCEADDWGGCRVRGRPS